MYLKNISATALVTINTSVGKVGLKPLEVIDLKYKLVTPVSDSIRNATKEEFLQYLEKTGGLKAVIDAELAEKDTIESKDTIPSDVQEIKLPETSVLTVTEPQMPESQVQEPTIPEQTLEKQEALNVKNVKLDKKTQLENKINDLTKTWEDAQDARQKEKIYKQLKKCKEQYEKLTTN